MKETAKVIAGLALVAALVVGGCALWAAHWSERSRLHPWWYCAKHRATCPNHGTPKRKPGKAKGK